MLRIEPEPLEALLRHAEETYPNESCGILVGRVEGDAASVVEARRARNLDTARAADRYDLDPADFLAADTAARERSLDVVGFYHSHPDHPASPSATDLAAAWEAYFYVIVEVAGGRAAAWRAWRKEGDRFVEVPRAPHDRTW